MTAGSNSFGPVTITAGEWMAALDALPPREAGGDVATVASGSGCLPAEGGIGSRIRSGTTAAGSGAEPAPVRGAPAPSPAAAPPVALGPRERRSVKALRAAGNSVGEIAWALDVPRAAVEAVLADQRRGAR